MIFVHDVKLAEVLAHLATGFDSFTDKQRYKSPGQQQTQAQVPTHMSNITDVRIFLLTHYRQPTYKHHRNTYPWNTLNSTSSDGQTHYSTLQKSVLIYLCLYRAA